MANMMSSEQLKELLEFLLSILIKPKALALVQVRKKLHIYKKWNERAMNVEKGLQTRGEIEWVMELERNRVRAENKLADAAYMMAEAANKTAEASLINADSRKQLEGLNAVVEVVRQLSSVLAARDSH